jgi:3-hydroxyisobutyrate dehydrogenase-like beta-hydroxyacid dehydrogenase
MRVAMLGLGDMGGPMASHVIAAGHDVALHDPMPAAIENRVTPGVRVSDSPAAAAEGAEIVGVVVRDDAAKLARNLMHYQVWVATHDSMALAEAAGLDLRAFEHLVRESHVADLIGHQLARDTTAPVDPARDPERAAWIAKMVQLGWKDLDDAFALADEVGTDVTMGEIARHRFGPAMNVELYPT